MQLYAPTSSGPKRKSFRAPPLANLEGLRIGILENGKLNAEEMLREVGALFVERHGCSIRPIYSKSNASAPAPANTLVKAAQDVDFLITGLGIEAPAQRAVCTTASASNNWASGRWCCARHRSR